MLSHKELLEIARTQAFSPETREWLDEMDAERAFETAAELDEAEDEGEDNSWRKRPMDTRLWFAVPELEVKQTGVTFTRKKGNNTHGELTVRQNHIVWRPKGNEYVFNVTWEQLAQFAEDNGKRVRPKTTPVKSKKKLKGSAA
jgi:hypothetical protein